MLVQVASYNAPHRIEDEINTLPPREFGGRNKIGIAGNKNDLIDLFLVCNRCDIETDLHVGSFLSDFVFEIAVCQIGEATFPFEYGRKNGWLNSPSMVILKAAKTQCDLPQAFQLVMKFQPKSSDIRLCKIDGDLADRTVSFL